MALLKALKVKALLQSGASDDGCYGLMGFRREHPSPQGDDAVWLAVPTSLLPHMATEAIRIIPQPESGLEGHHPAVFEAMQTQVGIGPLGEIVLTITFDQGAALSVRIDENMARGLRDGITLALGDGEPDAPAVAKLN